MAGTDLVVIGAGPGGYVAAIRAAQLGMKVVIAEKDACGGTCLNYGCIPTKALYKNAQVMGYMDRSREFGIEIDGYRLDMEQVQARKNKIVKTLTGGVEYLLKSNKVAIEKGCAKIIKAGLVEVTGKDGTVKRLETKRILIASGSKSSRLPIEGMDLEGVITSKEALDMKTVPEEIVIIGGGVIGIEFAGIYQSFGAKVTVVEFMPHIIPNVDVEITSRLKSLLEKRGISIMTGSKVEKIEKKGNNLSVQVDAGGKKQVLSCGQVLVSTGREMDADGLNLDGAGVRYDRKGIKVDENYETNVPGIYAIGDVTGRVMLAHVASEEGKTAVERMAGEKTEVDYSLIPNSIFTFPDVSSIGLSEEQAKEQGIEYITSKYQISGNGKALTMGENKGFAKFVYDKATDEILGFHIIGPRATDLAAEVAAVMECEGTVAEIGRTVHPHPTVSEVVMEAAHVCHGTCVNAPKPRK